VQSDELAESDDLGANDRVLTDEELEDLLAPEETATQVTFSSQDFDVAGLVRRIQTESMLIPRFGGGDDRVETAGFQRGFVWRRAQMDRFIESLLLGYPVPGIFLIKQTADNRMLVLDGQQRLLTLTAFFEGRHNNRPFALTNVIEDFKGLTYSKLPESLKFKLDDSYMQATIVTTDGSAVLNDAIYQIFERLNAGGTQLTPHEIRVALAAGKLVDYLESLNSNVHWRALYGTKSPRLRDQELVLRILALHTSSNTYSRPLKRFLNEYANTNRELSEAVTESGALFADATKLLSESVGREALRRPGVSQVNVAQAEAVIVGTMDAIKAGRKLTGIGARLEALFADKDFIATTTRATADNESVALRLKLARTAIGAG
jgi:hypothetical protein